MGRWHLAATTGLMLAALSATSLAAESGGRIEEGRALAQDACSACHQVSSDQKKPPPVVEERPESGIAAPSFAKIARDRRSNAAFLRKVITRPHYPMREQAFDEDDLDAIIAYILSLRSPNSRAR